MSLKARPWDFWPYSFYITVNLMLKTTLIQKVLLVLFGITCSLIIVSICLQIMGFVYLISQEHRNRVSLLRGSEYRILFLGESTTAEGGWNSYPRKLGRILEQRLPGRKFAIINKGSPGIDTTYILSKLEYNLNQYQPNMVVAMMGINDVVAGAPERQNVSKFKKFVKDLRLYKLLKFFLARLHEKDMLKEIYLARAWYFQEVDNYPKAERLFGKAIAIRPKDYDVYIEFARYYVEREDYPKAEEMFAKAIEVPGNNYMPYIEFGKYYRERENYLKSEEMFKNALEVSGGNYQAFFELGECYTAENELIKAEEIFKKCIDANPRFSDVYFELGKNYRKQHRYAESRNMLVRALELNPDNGDILIELGWCYFDEGNPIQAEISFKKAIEINPKEDIAYTELSRFYKKEKRYLEAEGIIKEVVELIRSTDKATNITIENYRKLKKIVLDRGIKLVCVQYPRRKLESLKSMFRSPQNVIFVDNEKIFNDAIDKGVYEDYFVDRFAGDFGHANFRGNELLANNVADVLIKEYFSKAAK